jgi:hypothetical protein
LDPAYAKLVDTVLWSARRSITVDTDGFNFEGSADDWKVITWKAKITFNSGHKMEILEHYKKDDEGRTIFGFNYHFMDSEGNCIFRFDTHGYEFPLGEPCHIHLGPNEKIAENGDGLLCGFGLENIDFLDAFRLANRVIKGRPLPWE